MGQRHNLRFFSICAVVFATGALLRFQAGWLNLPWAQKVAPQEAAQAGLPADLRDAVLKFYDDLDRGNYADAADRSYEVRWGGLGQATCIDSGLVSKEDFIRNATAEMGENGSDLTLSTIDFAGGDQVATAMLDTTAHPELLALNRIPSPAAESIYRVELAGSLLEHCAPAELHAELLVANIPGAGWRILLPGLPDGAGTRVEQWFHDKDVFAGKTIICSVETTSVDKP